MATCRKMYRKNRRTRDASGDMELEEWTWRGIRIFVPEDWEMLLFSRNLKDGSCTFADKGDYRLQVAWSEMKMEPDISLTMNSYIKKLKLDNAMARVERIDMKGWKGSSMQEDGEVPTYRFLRYFREPALLLEVIFPSCPSSPPPIKNILAKLMASEDMTRWRVFGMELKTFMGMAMANCEIKPASAKLEFASSDKKNPVLKSAFGRFGMLKHWLKGSPADYLKLQLPRNAYVEEEGEMELKGHPGFWVRGRIRRRPLKRIILGLNSFVSSVWTCPANGRLHTRYHEYKPGGEIPMPPAVGGDLLCCKELLNASV